MVGKKKNGSVIVTYALILAIAAVAVLILSTQLHKSGSMLSVSVTYNGNSRQWAEKLKLSEQEIVRITGLASMSISDSDSFKSRASVGLDYKYGYLYVEDVKVNGRKNVELVLNSREPLAVISSANNTVIDKNGTVLDASNKYRDDSLTVIYGLELTRTIVSKRVEPMSEQKFEDALTVANVIKDNRYGQIFTEIYVMENRDIRLMTYNNVPVIINMRSNRQQSINLNEREMLEAGVLKSLDIAYSMLSQGISGGGTIYVTGDNGYFDPDLGEVSTKKGM